MMIFEILSVHPSAMRYASFSTRWEAETALADNVRFPKYQGYRIFETALK
jgi:hypothetical protein